MNSNLTATITGTSLVAVERNDYGLVCQTMVEHPTRPASLADADRVLAASSLIRTGAWDLSANGTVSAPLRRMDNVFNGTVAANLDTAVGTTHDEWVTVRAEDVENGDLVSDLEFSETYVVAGCSHDGSMFKIHQVRDGKEWADRFTGHFHPNQLVECARKR